MNGIKPAGTQLTLVKSQTQTAKATTASEKAPAQTAVRANTSATVLTLTSQSREVSGSKNSAVRSYDEAKDLADDVAKRLKGDEHNFSQIDTVKGLFTTN
ncbi:MAG: hypothetical protein KDD66_13335 [Bdellovibrionales bacterium]|nr:hypothetical protein [Bdellovibrionales bacterium]